MNPSLARFVLGGWLAAVLGVGSAPAAEPIPSASPSPLSQSSGPSSKRPQGVVGDVDEETLRQKKAAAKETVEKNPVPVSKEAIKQQDKAKAVQTGDDATLRDLPSPAEKGSE
jgi:hypothetical protein